MVRVGVRARARVRVRVRVRVLVRVTVTVRVRLSSRFALFQPGQAVFLDPQPYEVLQQDS